MRHCPSGVWKYSSLHGSIISLLCFSDYQPRVCDLSHLHSPGLQHLLHSHRLPQQVSKTLVCVSTRSSVPATSSQATNFLSLPSWTSVTATSSQTSIAGQQTSYPQPPGLQYLLHPRRQQTYLILTQLDFRICYILTDFLSRSANFLSSAPWTLVLATSSQTSSSNQWLVFSSLTDFITSYIHKDFLLCVEIQKHFMEAEIPGFGLPN